jgi:hypothetical protein
MNSDDQPELNPEFETAELRRQMGSTGITGYLEDDLPEIELESAESLLARLKSIEETGPGTVVPIVAPGRRRLVPTLLAGTAAAVVAGVLVAVQPWSTPVAQASTPPLLDYEFAEAARIADAPGVDPAEMLEQLALAAERAPSGTSASAVLHVVHDHPHPHGELAVSRREIPDPRSPR